MKSGNGFRRTVLQRQLTSAIAEDVLERPKDTDLTEHYEEQL